MLKMVNGVVVDMTPDEIARRQAEDAAFEVEKANPKPPSKSEFEVLVEALEAKGVISRAEIEATRSQR